MEGGWRGGRGAKGEGTVSSFHGSGPPGVGERASVPPGPKPDGGHPDMRVDHRVLEQNSRLFDRDRGERDRKHTVKQHDVQQRERGGYRGQPVENRNGAKSSITHSRLIADLDIRNRASGRSTTRVHGTALAAVHAVLAPGGVETPSVRVLRRGRNKTLWQALRSLAE